MIATELRLAEDLGGLLRRECPGCHRQFKAARLDDAVNVVHRYLRGRVGQVDVEPGDWASAAVVCFYCGRSNSADACLTPEQRAYLEGVAESFSQQVRYAQLSQISRNVLTTRGATFYPVAPASMPKPPAEPEDMRTFFLPCCGEEAKAAPGWDEAFYCPRCGVRHSRGSRARLRLAFLRE